MRIEFVTLFPQQVLGLAGFGVIGRAVERGLVELGSVNPRDFADDVHRTVDDRPYGGGPGMVMKVEPLRAAIRTARRGLPAGSPWARRSCRNWRRGPVWCSWRGVTRGRTSG